MGVTWDDLARALGDVHRRRVLVALLEGDPEEPVRLPESIHPGEREPDSLMIDLVHRHLPMLEDMKLVDWERGSDRVGRGPCFDEIESALAALHERRGEPPDGWIELR